MTDTQNTDRAAGDAAKPDPLSRLASTPWVPDGLDEAEKVVRIGAASAMLDHIGPADGMETMLAIQMVATHEAATDCPRRAMTDDAPPEIRDENLKHSERLLALYARQMDVLGRHRIREIEAPGSDTSGTKTPETGRIASGNHETCAHLQPSEASRPLLV